MVIITLIHLLKAQKSLASQNINTLSPTNPADPAYACFVYMLATASSPSP